MQKFINKVFINREYSWLQFNERVLEESMCESNPLLEKCKFLSIFTSNLDEFFMVRVGTLLNDSENKPKSTDNKTNLTPKEQLETIYHYTKKLYSLRSKVVTSIFKQLKEEGLKFQLVRSNKSKLSKRFEKYFKQTVLPLLSPIVVSNKHPLIRLENLKTYVVLHLEDGNGKTHFGMLPIPHQCERLISETSKNGTNFVTLEDLTYYFAEEIFSKYKILDKVLVRLTRSTYYDIETFTVDYETGYDFSTALQGQLEKQSHLYPVRLEISSINGNDNKIVSFLCKHLDIDRQQCFAVNYFFDYKFLFSLDKFIIKEHAESIKYPRFKGRLVKLSNPNSIINSILKKDIFLSYPFDSMDTFMDLLDAASIDERVTSIKIAIYRLDKQSRIIEALRRASRNGKDVNVIIELAARFDEENNLYFASVLRDAGCTINYGVDDYKVHSKITLIVLKVGNNISYITHLGTGNYCENTSKQYTDLNIITADDDIGTDAADFFRNVAMSDINFNYKELLVAPQTLKEGILLQIKEQAKLAQEGKPSGIIFKMNSLTDLDCIKELIKASCAGVKVQLIVRGICCLLPGVPGKTENITVKSIIGRFLEHSRIYCFGTENPKIYISSADIMTRNVSRRVEIATPVKNPEVQKKILKILEVLLCDNEKASHLTSDGIYVRLPGLGTSSQQYFMDNII